MRDAVFQNLGLIGTLVFVSAYFPQIKHLLKAKDSTGMNLVSWFVWLSGAILLLCYALYNHDLIFITLTIMETLALLWVVVSILKFRKH